MKLCYTPNISYLLHIFTNGSSRPKTFRSFHETRRWSLWVRAHRKKNLSKGQALTTLRWPSISRGGWGDNTLRFSMLMKRS